MDNFDLYEYYNKARLNEGRGEQMADKIISQLREKVFKSLNDDELDAFKKRLLQAILLDSEYNKLYEGLNDNMDLDDIAKFFESAHPELRFNVNDRVNRIDVRGSQQDMYDFGQEHQGQTYGEYEVFATEDDDQGQIVRIVKSKDIVRNEGDGLWDNIRAKRARGEKPASKNSKAYKSAVAAGKRINKEK